MIEHWIEYDFNNKRSTMIVNENMSLLDIKLFICTNEGFLNINDYKLTMWRDKKPTIYLENDDEISIKNLFIKDGDLFCMESKNDRYKYPYK